MDFSKIKLPETKITHIADFFAVYTALSGKVIPVAQRRDFLIEYRFTCDRESGWTADKNSVYEQLLRNFKFDEKKYPDFDTLREKVNKMPGNIFVREDTTHSKFIEKTIPSVEVKPLAEFVNPYTKGRKKKEMAKDIEKKNITNKENSYTPVGNRIGEKTKSRCGQIMEIIAQRGEIRPNGDKYVKVDVRFEDGAIAKDKRYSNFRTGNIAHPGERNFSKIKSKNIKKSTNPNHHLYTYEEEKLIIERKLSNEELAEKIGVSKDKIWAHRSDLARKYKVNTIEDLNKRWRKGEPPTTDTKKNDIETPSTLTPVDIEQTAKEESSKNEDTKDSSYVSSLIDRTMELMGEFEKLSKTLAGKERDLRTKARYETLLKVLIKKDLRFFELTAGDKKEEAQDKYLKSIGFTDTEIKHLR